MERVKDLWQPWSSQTRYLQSFFRVLMENYIKIVSVIPFSCYMQPKAFLSETTANCEFYMAPIIAKLWFPYFLLSTGQWRGQGLVQIPL